MAFVMRWGLGKFSARTCNPLGYLMENLLDMNPFICYKIVKIKLPTGKSRDLPCNQE
jgi:hypothetical protein